MVLDAGERQRRMSLKVLASSVFKPSVPIDSLSIFRGRASQIEMAIEAINQAGQNPVIYGERGVGKTSLAQVLGQILANANLSGWKMSSVTCDSSDTFASLWTKAFSTLVITHNDIVLPQTSEHRRDLFDDAVTMDQWLSDDVTPTEVARVAALAQGHLIVTFDEFDQLGGNDEVTEMMANTIKTLSDQHINATIIIVGVADSVDELLKHHPSTERNLIQVRMPRMAREEIAELVRDGLEALDFTVTEDALAYIVAVVQGLPSPAHRIGLQCCYLLIDSGRTECTKDDVARALEAVCAQMSEGQLKSWDSATGSSRKDALFAEVLIACALTKRNELGWFSPVDVLEPFQTITHRADYAVSTYSQHLHLLADGRGQVLEKEQREGGAKRFQFRFRNPLFQAFVVMDALKSGALTSEALMRFEANLPR